MYIYNAESERSLEEDHGLCYITFWFQKLALGGDTFGIGCHFHMALLCDHRINANQLS
jgi:hypothetical protein